VAEKRPVRRCLGQNWRMVLMLFSKPKLCQNDIIRIELSNSNNWGFCEFFIVDMTKSHLRRRSASSRMRISRCLRPWLILISDNVAPVPNRAALSNKIFKQVCMRKQLPQNSILKYNTAFLKVKPKIMPPPPNCRCYWGKKNSQRKIK
jgi:hypothetical protein